MSGSDSAISESAKRGGIMFFSSVEQGGANCSSCHSGDFFTDEDFHVLATPQIGRGKGNANTLVDTDDFGRYRETGDSNDLYKFRTPTLLNVEETGPWGHAGAYTTLEAMVRHMLNPGTAIASYDYSQLEASVQTADMLTNTHFALEQLALNRSNQVESVHHNVAYTEDDVDDLVEFLKALTDPSVQNRDCLAPWIPNTSDANPDNLRLEAVDENGSPL